MTRTRSQAGETDGVMLRRGAYAAYALPDKHLETALSKILLQRIALAAEAVLSWRSL